MTGESMPIVRGNGWGVKAKPDGFDAKIQELFEGDAKTSEAIHEYINSLPCLEEPLQGQEVIVMGNCGWEHATASLDDPPRAENAVSVFLISPSSDGDWWVTDAQINKKAASKLKMYDKESDVSQEIRHLRSRLSVDTDEQVVRIAVKTLHRMTSGNGDVFTSRAADANQVCYREYLGTVESLFIYHEDKS